MHAELLTGLAKTSRNFLSRLKMALMGKSQVDSETLDSIEQALVESDVGAETTIKIMERLEERVAREKYANASELKRILKEEIMALISGSRQVETPNLGVSTFHADSRQGEVGGVQQYPYVIMVVGVNGVGKTTTIGKLAYRFKKEGKSVLLGAADTFRAAAVDQLRIWAGRVNVPLVAKGMGADPASVAFDTLNAAISRKADVVICDTAGRLHNRAGLMNELSKIKRAMKKVIHDAPHESLLVIDASLGQNALRQAEEFMKVTDVNAIALTKLDGTAKGGVVIGISDRFKIPVKYIGTGEKVEDLQLFDEKTFVDSLFNEN